MIKLKVDRNIGILVDIETGEQVAAVMPKYREHIDKFAAVFDLIAACEHVRANLSQESEEVWEHEIAHLNHALALAGER